VKFEKIRFYLSAPRLSRYLKATDNRKSEAARFYMANLRLAKSFHPVLGLLEVILRNCLNNELSAHFKDPDWILNQKNGFMNDSSLTYIHPKTGKKVKNTYLRTRVIKAEKALNKRGAVITAGKLIAEQTFGFWTSLFEKTHYKLVKGRVIKCFKHLLPGTGRVEVLKLLNDIRKFRNRINHNEPICFRDSSIDITYSKKVHESIYEILPWIDPELVRWVKTIDSVEIQLKNINTYT